MIKRLFKHGSFTLAFLVACGIAVGEVSFRWVIADMIWAASSLLASAAGAVLAFVWGVRKHVEEKFRSITGLSIPEMRNVEKIIGNLGRSVLILCLLMVLCVGISLLPWLSNKLIGYSWHWMYLLAGASLGFAAFSILITISWREQIDQATRERQITSEATRRQADLITMMQKDAFDINNITDWGRTPPIDLTR